MRIIIPKQNKFIDKKIVDVPAFIANGTKLSVHIPLNKQAVVDSWEILEDYTERICPNPEAALQDIDDIEDVLDYHFDKSEKRGYLIFTAVDQNHKPRVITPTEITKVNGHGIGLIYQIGHDLEISNNDKDWSASIEQYKHVSDLLPRITPFDKWAGTVTESRKEGPELEAILKADFTVLVPNEYWRPPAVQEDKIKDSENLLTEDLVLLGRNVPEKFGLKAAEAYLDFSYCEDQNLGPSLKLIRKYFKK